MSLLFVNRSAVLVRPKQPYLDWCKLDDETGIAETVFAGMRDEPSVYLIPDFEDEREQRLVLKEFWPMLFESMLEGWLREPSMWPQERTFKMFNEWFEVEQHSVVKDLMLDEEIEVL